MVKCNPNYKEALYAFYRYDPSTQAAAIFVALFAITSLLHAFQILRTRTWYLTALLCGGICETAGYVGRFLNTREDAGCWTMLPYVLQTCLILVAPALMAASIYMILGRIILLTDGESFALVKRKWLTKLFVAGDVISFAMQAGGMFSLFITGMNGMCANQLLLIGGGLMSSSMENMKTGEKIIIGGLFVQLAFFSGFVIVSAVFHRRMSLRPTGRANDPQVRWKTYLTSLYVTSTLIWIRSVFRVVEYIQGNDGSLISTEIYVFIFDGMLMLGVLLWMNWFHPSEIGLLLRGEQPIKNGFELVKVGGRQNKMRSSTMESLCSDHGPETMPRSFA